MKRRIALQCRQHVRKHNRTANRRKKNSKYTQRHDRTDNKKGVEDAPRESSSVASSDSNQTLTSNKRARLTNVTRNYSFHFPDKGWREGAGRQTHLSTRLDSRLAGLPSPNLERHDDGGQETERRGFPDLFRANRPDRAALTAESVLYSDEWETAALRFGGWEPLAREACVWGSARARWIGSDGAGHADADRGGCARCDGLFRGGRGSLAG
jgi:hypothetical protein